MVKNLPAMQETCVQSLGGEDSPGEGNGNPLQYSCLGNPMDGRLVGYSPCGRKESDKTERLHFHFQSLQSGKAIQMRISRMSPQVKEDRGQQ